MAVSSVQILGTGQLLELSRRLRAASGAPVQRNMARRIRRAAEPLRDDLQSTMRRLPMRSQGRSTRPGGPSPTTRPLRATLANAIRISVRTSSNPGARVWVDKSLLPSDLKFMPEALNNAPGGRHRHPVFNNRSRWVNQYVPPLWWDKTVQRHTPRMRAEVARVIDDVQRQLS
ncbi:hypothetical protein [Streptomyces sp. NBC_00842]|uniref:hypothetical protein n=1 Tax=Streptomyces sp. NBC_00842 TaxID=2975848 RepID=UPI00386FBF9A|nr:hypothetical protein OH821_17170 [Streptomyces sp. NBC_00842]